MGERFEGPLGWAEQVELSSDERTTLSYWLLHLPDQAPLGDRSYYTLGLITLADVEGYPPAHREFAHATHELMVQGMVSTCDPARLPYSLWQFVKPVNVAVQFSVVTDDQAREVTYLMARACTDGLVPADTSVYMFPTPGQPEGRVMLIKEALDRWKQVVRNTAEHTVTGGHPHLN